MLDWSPAKQNMITGVGLMDGKSASHTGIKITGHLMAVTEMKIVFSCTHRGGLM